MNNKNYIPFDPDRIPADTFHPGNIIKDELEARDMKQQELAARMGISKSVLSQIIQEKKNITPSIAIGLEKALGIKAEFWVKYELHYEIDTIRIKYRNMLNNNNINASKRKSIQKAIVSY